MFVLYKSNIQDIGSQYFYLQLEFTMWPIRKLVKYVLTLLAVNAIWLKWVVESLNYSLYIFNSETNVFTLYHTKY